MIASRCYFYVAALCCLPLSCSVQAEDPPPIFEADVQPILASKCGKCHSDAVQKGALNLASMAGLRVGGESGESAVADTLDDSLLWIMIDGDSMPPEDQPQLTTDEREVIRRWLEGGAKSNAPHEPTEKKLNQHDVLPIVLLRCTACHGATLKQAGVDLRTVADMKRGGKNGPALVPGDAKASLMIHRIESEACPPRDQLLKFFVRRPPASEVDVLKKWIEAGAPEENVQTDVATTEPDTFVTDEDRQHWAFQPPQKPTSGDCIDDFILRKLTERGLEFSPEADRDALIRRAYLDLIGLPPSVDEWKLWRHSDAADWYDRMIDHLLASPHYGERWGRYWLDLAGYADSEGGVSSDPVRVEAWKYRDYVINAFNKDKPYDRFLVEQIAGDELLDAEAADVVTDEMVENLTATGFLRMGIDQTGSRTMNFVPERLGVINDAITVVGSGLMGVTLECARCHSHKYDPIPHRDYYRFKAVFQGAFDEYDWLSFRNRKLNVATPDHLKQVKAVNPPLTAELKKLRKQLAQAQTAEILELLRQHYPQQSEADRKETLRALRIADNSRSQPQRVLAEMLQTVQVLPDEDQPPSVQQARRTLAEMQDRIETIQQQMVPSTTIRAVWDRGRPSPTYILRRGDHDKAGPLVGPGVPSMLTDGQTPFTPSPPFPNGTPKTGRRLAFARWLTRPDHPTTARVMVNRVWYHHFGTGLVKSLENFGVQGDRPTHPELLDWLAVTFAEDGWSIKQLHRRIMTSRTFRQSSHIGDKQHELDPDNRLLSRMPLRRMDAEVVRDSLLFVSGMLNATPGGRPDPISVDRNGLVSAKPTLDGRWRRSVYLQFRRTEIPSLLDTFDYPEMGPNCFTRTTSTVSPQALMLQNNALVRTLANHFAKNLPSDGSLDAVVEAVYAAAFSRSPADDELAIGIESLQSLTRDWDGDRQAAVQSYCHAILNSAAFVYID